MGGKEATEKSDKDTKMQADGEDEEWEDEADWTDGDESEDGPKSKDRCARAELIFSKKRCKIPILFVSDVVQLTIDPN